MIGGIITPGPGPPTPGPGCMSLLGRRQIMDVCQVIDRRNERRLWR